MVDQVVSSCCSAGFSHPVVNGIGVCSACGEWASEVVLE